MQTTGFWLTVCFQIWSKNCKNAAFRSRGIPCESARASPVGCGLTQLLLRRERKLKKASRKSLCLSSPQPVNRQGGRDPPGNWLLLNQQRGCRPFGRGDRQGSNVPFDLTSECLVELSIKRDFCLTSHWAYQNSMCYLVGVQSASFPST